MAGDVTQILLTPAERPTSIRHGHAMSHSTDTSSGHVNIHEPTKPHDRFMTALYRICAVIYLLWSERVAGPADRLPEDVNEVGV